VKRVRGTESAIFRFVNRRVLRGSIILGFTTGLMNVLQALGYAGSYTTQAAREQFAHVLSSSPALGILYGAPVHLELVKGYMVYRTMNFFSLIGAIWGLLWITKMLRGQEEDGRWEQLLSGQTTNRRTTLLVLAAGAAGVAIAFVICSGLLVLTGQNSQVGFSAGDAVYYGLAMVILALPAMALGAFASQLASTRRRAVLYGLVPLIALFLVRGVGVVADKYSWLTYLTPFGWLTHLQPILNPQPVWLIPILAFAAVFAAAAVYLAGKRDLGESLIAQSDVSRSHLALVRSPLTLAFRLTGPTLLVWLLSSLGVMGLFAALTKLAADTAAGSDEIGKSLAQISGNASTSISVAFLSFGLVILGTMLMAMMANTVGQIRGEESRGYLDNFLVRRVSRTRWLLGRLAVAVVAAFAITLASTSLTQVIVSAQGIDVDATKLILGSLNILGPTIFLLGVGVLLYGLKPRLAVLSMYLVLAWSFTIDMIGSVFKLNDTVAHSSLLHYIALVPAADPDWKAFTIITAIGVVLAAVGVYTFNHRDLQGE
jgi:ABC-2 type transport system permease protein